MSGNTLINYSNANLPEKCNVTDEHRRIWVGNLDTRITDDNYRFQLLKIMQKCGAIEKFDMLFHKGGPMVGQSRGYAFVTFKQHESAINALLKLDGINIGSRSIAVRLAKNIKHDVQQQRARIDIPALGCGSREKINKLEAIHAIETKLKTLERQTDGNLELNTGGSEANVPFIQRYQFNKDRDAVHRNKPQGKYTKAKQLPPNRRHL